MSEPRIVLDFSGLQHCAASGKLVVHLETRTFWEVSQYCELKEGLKVRVASSAAGRCDIEARGVVYFGTRKHQWYIEFCDEDIELHGKAATRRAVERNQTAI